MSETKPIENTVEQVLFGTLINHYQSYSKFINSLPIPDGLKQIILQHLDTSYLWAKDSFATIRFNSAKPEEIEMPKELQDAIKDGKVVDIDSLSQTA